MKTNKTKMLCVCASLAAVLCQFAPIARAYENEGDWCPTGEVQWWWKYVFPQKFKVLVVDDRVFDAERVNPATFDSARAMTFTLRNTSPSAFNGGGSAMLVHTIRGADGSVLSSEIMSRAPLPALRSGETFRLRGTANTSARLRGQKHYIEVQTQ